jgi:hypothetical protein
VAQNPQDPEALRNALTREVTTDAYNIAGQIFRGPQPDVSHVNNDALDQRYLQAINTNDRQYLMSEAARDPTQFLSSMGRLHEAGKIMVPPDAGIPQEPPLPPGARSDVPIPKPPEQSLPATFKQPDQVPAVPALPSPPTAPGPVPLGMPPVQPTVPSPPLQPGPAGAPMPPPGAIA